MYKNYFLLFCIFLVSLSSFSQNFSEEKIYSWYDEQTGIENSTLFGGIEYVEEHRMINENHKFFETQEFRGTAISYNGQEFYNVPLKYNVYDDLVLVNLKYDQKNAIFQLINNRVEKFNLNGHQFVYLDATNDPEISGFFEEIEVKDEFKVYKKYTKDRQERQDKQVVYHEFKNDKATYYFEFKNEVSELGNRRDLFAIFPDLKDEIREFYRKNRKEARNEPDTFMRNLAIKMNSLNSNFKNEI